MPVIKRHTFRQADGRYHWASKEKRWDSVGEAQKASESVQKREILVIFDPGDAKIASDFQFSIFRQQNLLVLAYS
jgi:hypothetical protein